MERPLSVETISQRWIERNWWSSAHSSFMSMGACSENGNVPPIHRMDTVAFSIPWKEMIANQLWRISLNILKEKPAWSPKWLIWKLSCTSSIWRYKTHMQTTLLTSSNPSNPLPKKSKSQISLELTYNNSPLPKNGQGGLSSKSPVQTRSAKRQGAIQ